MTASPNDRDHWRIRDRRITLPLLFTERQEAVSHTIDAMTDANRESHIHSLTTIFPRLNESGATREILDL
jgi:hypothetical protein